MKMKEFGPPGGAHIPGTPLDLPMNTIPRMPVEATYRHYLPVILI